MNLDTDLVSNIRINLSAIERRTSTLTKRRSVKKEYQAAWLLKAISLIDLTTLSGDDTHIRRPLEYLLAVILIVATNQER